MIHRGINTNIEEKLVELANTGSMKKGKKLDLQDYQRVDIYVYDQIVLNAILDEFKFKGSGTIYDYPDYLEAPSSIDGYAASIGHDVFQKLAVSNKYNSVVYYSKDYYSINCMFLIDLKYLDKFLERVGEFLKDDATLNEFKDADLSYKPKTFIEIAPCIKDETKDYDVIRKTLTNENLVYDERSTIYQVKQEIESFFSQKTEDLYKKLDLPYKRGIMLYGNPGNGKSAMVREIIRTGPAVSKIIIGSSIKDVPYVLSSVIKALNGTKAIIIMEDFDSMINGANRSEFLNILDGVDIKSGLFIIGTTNYPERIDSGFTNRSGRFDRMYKIENPSEDTRRLFFTSRKLYELFDGYKVTNKKKDIDLIKLFVDNSVDLPMASLKEIITNVAYTLATNKDITVEDAVKNAYKTLTGDREEHQKKHNEYLKSIPNINNTGVMNVPSKLTSDE